MTIRNMIKSTDDNLRSKVATEPLIRWLISAAKKQTPLQEIETDVRDLRSLASSASRG